jgi:hypothetical protein
MHSLIPTFILLSLALGSARAQLVPDKDFKEVPVAPEAANATVEFVLKNTGSTPATIRYVKTDPNVKASPQQSLVPPGQQSVVTFTYDIDWRMGDRKVQATLYTDDPAHPTIALSFVVHIPWFFKIEGRNGAFVWFNGEAPEERTLILTVPDNIPLEVTSMKNSNPSFTVTFEKLLPKVYKLSVKPPQTSADATVATRSLITLFSNFPSTNPKHFPFDADVLVPSPQHSKLALPEVAKITPAIPSSALNPGAVPAPLAPVIAPTPAPVAPAAPSPVAASTTSTVSSSAPGTVTITEKTLMKTLAHGEVSGFADANIGSHYAVLSVRGSELILEDAQGRHYLINQTSTDYAVPAPTATAHGTVTITEKTLMQTLTNGEVSGITEAKVGSHYSLVSVQDSRLVLQDDQGKQYLVNLSATDYVVP